MMYRLSNGTSGGGSSGGGSSNGNGGLFGWLGNLFSGFQFPSNGFNFPNQNQGNGYNIQPINFPVGNNQNSLIKPEYALIAIGALALYMIITKK